MAWYYTFATKRTRTGVAEKPFTIWRQPRDGGDGDTGPWDFVVTLDGSQPKDEDFLIAHIKTYPNLALLLDQYGIVIPDGDVSAKYGVGSGQADLSRWEVEVAVFVPVRMRVQVLARSPEAAADAATNKDLWLDAIEAGDQEGFRNSKSVHVPEPRVVGDYAPGFGDVSRIYFLGGVDVRPHIGEL